MARLNSLFTYLITNRPHETAGWLKTYKDFTAEVLTIRAALRRGLSLSDPNAYAGTRFERSAHPFYEFAEQLIYTQNNGVSSRGQSVLARALFDQFIAHPTFVSALEALIRTPDPDTFKAFREQWSSYGSGRHPLLINRVLAACTTEVSTTVDETKFERVYRWLIDEGLICPPEEPAEDWYTKNVHLVSELRARLRDTQSPDPADEHQLNIFVWQLYDYVAKPVSLKRQRVLYGPPGTGKTYTALEQARLHFGIWQAEFDPGGARKADDHIRTVQFHPSYSYEDFMEGLRPELVDGHARLRLKNGIFKTLCLHAARWELDVLRNASRGLAENWTSTTLGDLLPYKGQLHEPEWQTFLQHDPSKKVSDVVPKYFLIIDEMNRAELSRVLGELMFSLEYRGIKQTVQTQYAELNDETTGMLNVREGFRFFVPHNVYVTGTMNTIDRSVESFDFALRRRFSWEKVMPDTGVLRHHLTEKRPKWQQLADNLDKLNEAIEQEPLLGADYQIGHTYLMDLNYPSELTHAQVRSAVWDDFIGPLIEEYLRGTGKAKELIEEFEKAFGIC